jgi:hypothetical protein
MGPSEREEYILRQLVETKKQVALGQIDLARCNTLALQALCKSLYTWVICEEILRDTGELGNPKQAFNLHKSRVESVMKGWAALRDYPRLCMALIANANLFRTRTDGDPDKNYRRGSQFVQAAYHVAKGLCRSKDDLLLKILLHQAAWLRLKLIAFNARQPQDVESDADLIRTLAREIDSPVVWVVTLQEEAGRSVQLGRFDKAQEVIAEARGYTSKLREETRRYADLGPLRAEIDLLARTGHREAARARMRDYVSTWQKNPTFYASQIWREWEEVPTELASSTQVYVTSMIPNFYLIERLVEV